MHLLLFFIVFAFQHSFQVTIDETRSYFQQSTWENIETGLTIGEVQSFYNIFQYEALIRSYSTEFPEIVSQIVTIGTSVFGEPIYAIQIAVSTSGRILSNEDPKKRILSIENFNNHFQDRPAILYTGMHEGIDPITMHMSLYMIKRLIFDYIHNDPATIHLLKTRQLWFIPMVNRDRYDIASAGAILANMPPRNTKFETCKGVNLRLNYPSYNGSLTGNLIQTCNDDYQGSGLATEPEVQAVMALLEKVEFKVAINYFSRYDSVYLPLNYLGVNDPQTTKYYKKEIDSVIFSEIFESGLFDKTTLFGTLYTKFKRSYVGEVSDYMYWQKGIFALSVELGNTEVPKINALKPTEIVFIMQYYYRMSIYSAYKIAPNFYWSVLYQLVGPECIEQHVEAIQCPINVTSVFSAKYVINNDGLQAGTQLKVLLIVPNNMTIATISVQDTYSGLFNFQDTQINPIQFTSTKAQQYLFIIDSIPSQGTKVISISGYMPIKEQYDIIEIKVLDTYSYENLQNYLRRVETVGNVVGFKRFRPDYNLHVNPRKPSIILVIVYFVAMGVFLVGLLVAVGIMKISKKRNR